MAPKSAAPIILVAFVSLLAVAAAASRLGGWKPIHSPAVTEVVDAAKFAVEEYNRNQTETASLVLVSVVKGESRVVAGVEYRLVISARNGKLVGAAAENYGVDVVVKAWEKTRRLISFEKVLTA